MTTPSSIGATLVVTALFVGALAASPAVAQTERPIVQSDGLSAVFDGARCGPIVRTIITGPDRSFFTGAAPKVDALTRGARQLISSTCPAMGRLIVRGKVAGVDRTIYNAMLERPTGWRPSIVAATSSQAFLSDAVGGSASQDRANWRRSAGFMPAAAVLQLAGAGFLCADLDAQQSCSASTQFRGASAAGGVQVSRFVADNQGGEAIVTNRLTTDDGFLCVDASLGDIVVEGGTYTAEGRQDMTAQLEERIRDVGVLCTGYVQTASGVAAKTFNANGRAVTAEASRVTPSPTAPKLSLRR